MRTSRLWRGLILASPEPLIFTLVVVDTKPSILVFPLPLTITSLDEQPPFRTVILPEPLITLSTLLTTFIESILILPLPLIASRMRSVLMGVLASILPEPLIDML